MTAVTRGAWFKEVKCDPDSGEFPHGTRKCCWWGRGAIQTTGPCNYGKLNKNIIKKAQQMGVAEIPNVDLCIDPEAMCKPQYPSLKWIGAIEYWSRVVQTFSPFQQTLKNLAANGFVDAAGFNDGTGSKVNN